MSKEFFHPSVTADAVITRHSPKTGRLEILLIRRSENSKAFPNCLALPGGFVDADDEDVEACCIREVKEETGLDVRFLEQVGTWTKNGRDPRGPVHSTAFLVDVDNDGEAIAGDDASSLEWFEVSIARVTGGMARGPFDLIVMLGNKKKDEMIEIRTMKRIVGCRRIVESCESAHRLAFDHANIIATALTKDIRFTPLA